MSGRLIQAIITAPFHPAQRQIVLTLWQLQTEQQRQNVKLSLADLVRFCGYEKVTGGFRRQLKELITEGVVVIASAERGSTNDYGLQLDYQRWGRFAQTHDGLAGVWGIEGEHAAQLPLPILTVDRAGDPAPTGSSPRATAPLQGQGTMSLQGHPASRGSGSTVSLQGHPAPTGSGSSGVSAEKSTRGAGRKARSASVGGVGGGVVSSSRTTTTTPPNPPARRGEAIALLAKLDGMIETSQPPHGPAQRRIRLERVKSELGENVHDALVMLDVKRFLATKPENRGVLVVDFAAALGEVRAQKALPKEALG